jgi:hypothetical protein
VASFRDGPDDLRNSIGLVSIYRPKLDNICRSWSNVDTGALPSSVADDDRLPAVVTIVKQQQVNVTAS